METELQVVKPLPSFSTSLADGTVALQKGSSYPENVKAKTVPEVFAETVQKFGDRVAWRYEVDGKWVEKTWKQVSKECKKFAKALIAVGVKTHKAVAIQGVNCPQWMIANLGSNISGSISAGIYPTNNAETCQALAKNIEAELVVVQNTKQLNKYKLDEGTKTSAKCYVVWEKAKGETLPDSLNGKPVFEWSEFIKKAEGVSDTDLKAKQTAIKTNQCAALVFTSGTTGMPKGVMLSHDNITWTAKVIGEEYEFSENDKLVSYLPLSHIAAQMLDLYGPMVYGSRVSFARPDALKGSLRYTLKSERPTLFLGVPRVWEKFKEAMQRTGKNVSFPKRMIATWAKYVGRRMAEIQARKRMPPTTDVKPVRGFWWLIGKIGSAVSFVFRKINETYIRASFWVANKLVFSKIKQQLGFDRTRAYLSGAAPILPDTVNYFEQLSIPILDVYGMSECSGPQAISTPKYYKKRGGR